MARYISIDKEDYDIDELSEMCNKRIYDLKALDITIEEKKNLERVLVRAKRSYIAELKSEMLSEKAGFDFLE